jgi:hypothetical protein
MSAPEATFDSWSVVEIMGHRKLAGKALPPGGPGALASMLRIDVYDGDGDEYTTQFYGASAIFSLTPATEEVCRLLGARWHAPPPVQPWELLPATATEDPDLGEDDEGRPF